MVAAVAVALCAGCGGSPTSGSLEEPEVQTGLMLDGQVLFPQELEAAPPAVREAWQRYEQARQMERPDLGEDASLEEYKVFTRDALVPYLEAIVQVATDLKQQSADATGADGRLVFSVLQARVLHSLASLLWSLPLPAEGEVEPRGIELLRASLRAQARQAATLAAGAFADCVRAADALGSERAAWRIDCESRAQTLHPLMSSARATTQTVDPPLARQLPRECLGHVDVGEGREVPHPVPTEAARLLVVADWGADIDTRAVVRAVEERIQRDRGIRPVTAAQRARAEALVAQKKTRRGGPQCAARPSLSWVLGQSMHLVVAIVERRCQRAGCSIEIWVHDTASSNAAPLAGYGAAVTMDSSEGTTELSVDAAPLARWVAAAENLQPISALGMLIEQSTVEVGSIEGTMGYRIESALRELDIESCATGDEVAIVQTSLSVTAAGRVESIEVAEAAEPVASCIQQKLSQLALPCPPQAHAMSMRVCWTPDAHRQGE